MAVSIDVIIPSFRLNPATLLPILNLYRPVNTIKFYLVADNPSIKPDAAILNLIDNITVFLLINETNKGASETRNRGIEAGQGDWILFLDDDIDVPADLLSVYYNAITARPDETGFIGVVNMPPEPTLFAKAVSANGSMGIFTVAQQKPDFAWGATANIMVNREAVGNVRFADAYPKTGGGEEVEFFLRVREKNNFRNYNSLPAAAVIHPWWGNGKTDFLRFYRYGKGNSYLAQRNPAYRWYDFLNTPETLLITVITLVCTMHQRLHLAVFFFFITTIIIEYIVNIVRVHRSTKKYRRC
ncbi:glycosyltransferase [Mucilaginibacter terrigena]|uniref:Glycosyltransferase n=1 Tax=Mucilaginibacter terrigena TaxID=2492395 RepID=A0A4Q5LJX2_9SPHI|nr:glycosyltransferase family 2 protein [Mucilaginibacter terrigena]RYU87362.1 glycosyltransferase [Mucilaginibacter terrigena]